MVSTFCVSFSSLCDIVLKWKHWLSFSLWELESFFVFIW